MGLKAFTLFLIGKNWKNCKKFKLKNCKNKLKIRFKK